MTKETTNHLIEYLALNGVTIIKLPFMVHIVILDFEYLETAEFILDGIFGKDNYRSYLR